MTQKKGNHQANSVCAILCIDRTLSDFPYKKLKDKECYIDCIKYDTEEECERLILNFIDHLNSLADIIMTWLNTIGVEKQKRELRMKYWEEFTKEKFCIYCREPFKSHREPVFGHSHTHSK